MFHAEYRRKILDFIPGKSQPFHVLHVLQHADIPDLIEGDGEILQLGQILQRRDIRDIIFRKPQTL